MEQVLAYLNFFEIDAEKAKDEKQLAEFIRRCGNVIQKNDAVEPCNIQWERELETNSEGRKYWTYRAFAPSDL